MKNVGMLDRLIRLAIAAGAFYVFFTGERPAWEFAVLAVGIVMLLTAAFSFCPIYRIFGFRTCKAKA